ncbi:MAG: O-antigen ligase domain-containing protein [Comamonadaceae bacterium]|nr:MAG: O-antigen ligase domain-containing protein [Comamonadaceae bacterium]
MSWRQVLRAPVLPPVTLLSPRLQAWLSGALALFGFFLPFSVAGTSILLAALLAIALAAAPAVWRSAPWRDPVVAVGLLLFAYLAIHTLATSGPTPVAWGTINRYHELVMGALLLALFRLAARPELFFRGLVCGALLYALAHWAGLFWPPMARYLELRHISAGMALSLTAFVLLEQARGSSRPWVLRGIAAFLALTVLFAMDGRTGYLVLLLLVACAAWLQSPRRWRWASLVIVPLAVGALALSSGGVQHRIQETLAGTGPWINGGPHSTGIRIELLRTGVDVAQTHFATGAGYAEYGKAFESAARARYGPDPLRRDYLEQYWIRPDNPHNEYLMQLAGGGIVALALFLAWLALPILRKSGSASARASLVGVGLAFATGCLFNSMLMDFVEGHLYVALMTWLLAQARPTPP